MVLQSAIKHVPKHVAVVMDGNGRWAEKRFQPRVFGHRAGVKSVRTIVEAAAKSGVEVLTLFAFSSENWQRPQDEVSGLMELFLRAVRSEAEQLHRDGVRLRFIGELIRFADPLRAEMQQLVTLTSENTRLCLNVAVNYGGRWDIAQAARRIAQDVSEGFLQICDISENSIAPYLTLADLAPVDLFIRTGGDYRVSNFLLWQIAYAELYFTATLWPDFDLVHWQAALGEYAKRQRRFGKTGAQIANGESAESHAKNSQAENS
jgi:undecaprenyl diphosphate synthase